MVYTLFYQLNIHDFGHCDINLVLQIGTIIKLCLYDAAERSFTEGLLFFKKK